MRPLVVVLCVSFVSAAAAACAPSARAPSGSWAGDRSQASEIASVRHPHAARLWSDKCGSCHVPVEPGTRPRGAIEAAMQRHRTRAKLTDADWAEMVEFLAEQPTQKPVAKGGPGGA